MVKELIRCIEFIEKNGWEYSFEEDNTEYYDKKECLSIGIDNGSNEIIIFDDTGDIYHMEPNIYTLLGYLFQYHQIDCAYKFVNLSEVQ